MNKKTIIISGILLVVMLIFFYKNHISTDDIIGKYVNNNTEPLLDGPKEIQKGVDTLIIMKDNKFSSKTWGDGTYIIKSSLMETKIDFKYTYSMGKAGYEAIVSKPLFNKTKIWLNYDLNFYFEKMK